MSCTEEKTETGDSRRVAGDAVSVLPLCAEDRGDLKGPPLEDC